MKICVETDATNPNSKEIRKVNRSDHLHLFAEKMVQIKQNTSQPIKQENKKCVLSYRMIRSKDNGAPEPPPPPADGFPINL